MGRLRAVLRDEPARLWLRSPNPDLDWRKPLELVAEGEYRRVIGAVLGPAADSSRPPSVV